MVWAASLIMSLWTTFAHPPAAAKPWCYWWWINGHVDRETIVADLEAMKRLGFGGILLFDSRGYFDDENHVVNPKATLGWGTDAWYDLVAFSARECARLGLVFTLNASASGGTLNGFVDGTEYETDILDRDAVNAHLDRAVGPLLKRIPDLVGTTFTHIYSPSYEGSVKTGGSWRTIKDTFYATLRTWAHAHGLMLYSESGGPWAWGSGKTKLDCDQLDMLMHNDIPQGEFWPLHEAFTHPDTGRANRNGRFFARAAVLSARRENRPLVSLEAFTHMHRHYSADPAFLKPLADIAFADGVNRLVWHTFTCSPRRFGVPGAEYFAGSHVNRNVTWHADAGAFVAYLGRCQALLQRGVPVDDGAFVQTVTNYHGWGRFRRDAAAPFTMAHRREGAADFFFVAGEGTGEVVLNAPAEGRCVELWDAVMVTRRPLRATSAGTGRTRVTLDFPRAGSGFVVLAPSDHAALPSEMPPEEAGVLSLTNGWDVSFAYHAGITAPPPAPVRMPVLRDWRTYGADGQAGPDALRYFAGTATYRTDVTVEAWSDGQTARLSLGAVPTGLARVSVNGVPCGVAWCAPWEVDVTTALRAGVNTVEIRYTNNWYNRLVGDCFLDPAARVTRSTLRYWQKKRTVNPKKPWLISPTRHSGPSISDELQPSGLVGPVTIRLMRPVR